MDLLDELLNNANANEQGADLKPRPTVPEEFRIGNKLSDQLDKAEKLIPTASLIAALELMIRPNAHPEFTHPLLIDIYKTITLLAEATTNAVMVTRIRNRINRLKDEEFVAMAKRQIAADLGKAGS